MVNFQLLQFSDMMSSDGTAHANEDDINEITAETDAASNTETASSVTAEKDTERYKVLSYGMTGEPYVLNTI